MPRRDAVRHGSRIAGAVCLAGLLAGCGTVLLNPSGDVALQQRNLMIQSTILMLLIVVPVIALTLLFAYRYRASNDKAAYDPEWNHSTQLEVAIWSAPLAIIIALGAITWLSTHTLDPYRPLGRVAGEQPIPPGSKPLNVQVVALDWKWLFFYPDQGIATVNELAAPVDGPITFKITSATVMNSFFVPALAGQIYAMAGMETTLHAVINRPGDYVGLSANYSGAGFSRMNFTFRGLTPQGFQDWVAKVKAEGKPLDRAAYGALEKPSEKAPVQYFAPVENGLYQAILNLCAAPGKMCVGEMNHIDAMGGAGKESGGNRQRLEYDNLRLQQGEEAPAATYPASGRPPHGDVQPEGMLPRANSPGGVNPGSGPGAPGTPAPAQLNTQPSQPSPQ